MQPFLLYSGWCRTRIVSRGIAVALMLTSSMHAETSDTGACSASEMEVLCYSSRPSDKWNVHGEACQACHRTRCLPPSSFPSSLFSSCRPARRVALSSLPRRCVLMNVMVLSIGRLCISGTVLSVGFQTHHTDCTAQWRARLRPQLRECTKSHPYRPCD